MTVLQHSVSAPLQQVYFQQLLVVLLVRVVSEVRLWVTAQMLPEIMERL